MSPTPFTIKSRIFGRFAKLAFLITASLIKLSAQEQLTPGSLILWQATGTRPFVTPGQGTIVLPAGGQLVRSYPAGVLLIDVVSRPFFSAKAASRPILEVGPASVILVRNDSGGGVIMLGDQVLQLPTAIPLGSDGRSVKSIDLSLFFDAASNQAILTLDGATYSVAAKTTGTQLDVVVSAGSEADWTLDKLEVIADSTPSALSSSASATDISGEESSASPDAIEVAVINAALMKSDIGELEDTADSVLRSEALRDVKGLALSGDTKWHLDMASALSSLAGRLLVTGKTDVVQAVAALAANHFVAAAKLAKQSRLKASAWAAAAALCEKYAGDIAASKSYYRMALAADKRSRVSKKALERFDTSDRLKQATSGRRSK